MLLDRNDPAVALATGLPANQAIALFSAKGEVMNNDQQNMIHVNLDIAGFYYHRENIPVRMAATVRDVMKHARELDLAERYPGNPGRPVLNFSEDSRQLQFIQSITVDHSVEAGSRQNSARKYPPGEYTLRSDGVAPYVAKPGDIIKPPFIAVDLANKEINRPVTITWQYYLYDKNGCDRSRAKQPLREVNPYSFLDPKGSNQLTDGCTIVWRAVAIMIAPTRPASLTTLPSIVKQTNAY